jgi:regulation of enolase protein 1 (concanavalin A-like superfamily)
MKIVVFIAAFIATVVTGQAQDLEKMSWFNEPENWSIEKGKLTIDVTPQSDYWRNTRHGFVVDDAPFYYTEQGGEFEAVVKITGEYKSRFDQMGLMLRIDEQHWLKTGIEYVNGVVNFSAVITNENSNWSIMPLKSNPKSIWIKAIREKNAIEVSYSIDGKNFTVSNEVYLPQHKPVKVGMMAASPDGIGFKAVFEEFKITHHPDKIRLEWLNQQ